MWKDCNSVNRMLEVRPVGSITRHFDGLVRSHTQRVKLASALAKGHTLQFAAQESGIKISTARSYLEKIFAKTGTDQQSQLVALLKTVHPVRPIQP
jgi:DNA-binding NarL/FixJ family response regulator